MSLALRWYYPTDAWMPGEDDRSEDDKWPERDDGDERTCDA